MQGRDYLRGLSLLGSAGSEIALKSDRPRIHKVNVPFVFPVHISLCSSFKRCTEAFSMEIHHSLPITGLKGKYMYLKATTVCNMNGMENKSNN